MWISVRGAGSESIATRALCLTAQRIRGVTGAEAIIINHGELRAGTADVPFGRNLTITLHGHWQSPQLPVFGIKLIGLTMGKIAMYGTPKTSFVRTAATAAAGDTTIMLEAAPDGWQVGDALVVTSYASPIEFKTFAKIVC
jgi:hypothetical protein